MFVHVKYFILPKFLAREVHAVTGLPHFHPTFNQFSLEGSVQNLPHPLPLPLLLPHNPLVFRNCGTKDS